MKIAIVGGGLFGCTAAVYAARAGHDVHLYERGPALMQAASKVNQLRLHRGFHYPRSAETGCECRNGNVSFAREYGQAIIRPERRKHGGQFYAIAREGSKVSSDAFLAFCEGDHLPYRVHRPPFLDPSAVEIAVEVLESSIDPRILSLEVERKLNAAGAHVHLDTPATRDLRDRFDRVVIAAYASTNEVARELGAPVQPFQYEVIEKPVVRMPPWFRDIGVVVMDGPFGCIDPYGDSGLHLLGHVVHAIHAANTGIDPLVPEHLARYLNQGIVPNPEGSRIDRFIEAGKRFIPALDQAEHVGSMFTIRAVLPNVEMTDARPTLVQRLDPQTVRVFSGKLGTAVTAAERVVEMLAEAEKREAA